MATTRNVFWIPFRLASYADSLTRRRKSSKAALTSTQLVLLLSVPRRYLFLSRNVPLDAYSTGVAKTPAEGIEACASDVNNPRWPRKFS